MCVYLVGVGPTRVMQSVCILSLACGGVREVHCAVEPLIMDTLNKGHNREKKPRSIKDTL